MPKQSEARRVLATVEMDIKQKRLELDVLEAVRALLAKSLKDEKPRSKGKAKAEKREQTSVTLPAASLGE